MYSLTAIVPFYNEEQFLKQSVESLLTTGVFDEILLVDDCSFDLSSNIAKDLTDKNKIVKYLKTDKNGGKGKAISLAFSEATSSHIVIHDADLEYFPSDIKEMKTLSTLNENALILGSRFIGHKKRENIYLRTSIANRVMSYFFSIVNLYKVTDVATCYKLFPAKFVNNIQLKESGFSIEIELLSKFLKYNKEIIETPISYKGRSYQEGKKIKAIDGIYYLFNTLKYKFFY